MATEMNLAPPKSTFEPPSKPSNHETATPRQPINVFRLASLCIIGLISNLGDITHLISTAPTSLKQSNTTPATLTNPVSNHPPQTLTLLALLTLTTTLLHPLTHALPYFTPPTPSSPPTTTPTLLLLAASITTNLLQGFASACTLVLALCLSGGGARVRAVCVAGAVGTAVRAVGASGGSGGIGGSGDGGYERGLAGKGKWMGDEVLGEGGRAGAKMVLLDGGGGYPPPAGRATIFGALFAFAYHAAAVAIPAGLGLLGHDRDGTTGRPLPVFITAVFWAGVAVARVVALA
ncbi:predicted protein [Chaetomium globosum CBS 148.51]|uniref:Uncharacterized protein n=1 Tax=Chaetomium globosum (strain ATCC 6205 / CBS 148.51 / DSM 1962 / NBRC 6347 / NRRL 1970) TaxID=306901 RepID=Q2H263_CHAGB|nr:uncharacterized protein CHGG_04133 [Chaetomium globosum CBS 148.51]EAQ87514.1 predicted protein [Chaetomium globosum CBS 148.51]